MLSRSTLYAVIVCSITFAVMLLASDAVAESKKAKNPDIFTPQIEQSLTDILNAVPQGTSIPSQAIQQILDFSVKTDSLNKNIVPAERDYGTPAFFKTTVNVSLRDFLQYTLNPDIPMTMLYPSTVRWSQRIQSNDFLKNWKMFTESALPPEKNLIMRTKEEEETTPEVSSGGIYRYTTDCMYILSATSDKRPALITVSVMDGISTLGKKGVIVDESQWRYVYSNVIGTNLPFLGWAETAVYSSAGITIAIENTDKQSVSLYFYKWTKAGWSGMNMVKTSHIIEGFERFINSLKQIIEAPNAPTPDTLAKEATRIASLSDGELFRFISPIDSKLQLSDCKALRKKPFKALVEKGYSSTLSRREAEAEALLIRLRALLNMK